MNTLARIAGYLRPYRWQFAAGLLCLLLGQPLQLVNPLFWRFVVDEVLLGKSPPFIEWFHNSKVGLLVGVLALMFLVQLVGAAISALHGFILGVVANRIGYDMRNELYERLQTLSLRFFHDSRSGDLLSRATGDVEQVTRLAANGVDELIGSALQLVIVWGIVFWMSWQVAVSLVVPMTLVALLAWRFNKRVRPLYRAARDRMGELSAKIQENIAGIGIIKSFAREPYEQGRVENSNRRHYDKAIEALRLRSVFGPQVRVVGFLSNLIMLGVGAYFVMRGSFTVGGLLALRAYWHQLFAPIGSLARVNDRVQRSAAAADRVFAVMDHPVEIADAPDAVELDRVEGAISFENVSFAYNDDHEHVLTDFSVRVDPGQALGVVGPSGAGKSTLLGLLMRLYDPQAGYVRIDGHDLRRVSQASLRRQMALVSQDPFLFNETIRENILFGRLEATDEEIFEAARQANAHEFIEACLDGYDTVVGERGVKLSGGQKQRICIARAFLANPRILLLDEATSAVEPESEALIQAALERLTEGRTSVIVSHRLSMVRNADQILVIRDGRATEQGTHNQLMARDDWYARMYRMQMGETPNGQPLTATTPPPFSRDP
ncbi:MAG TPA: ABC transporter ATP-binding protein [Phycisphaerae bacterium]|nr:ABC transporter ATP-binding protein [Phycisphaerae bacterium]